MTECSDDSGMEIGFHDMLKQKSKPSNVAAQAGSHKPSHDESHLGKVHLELARYHEVCRFTDDGTYDVDAAMFHLKCSAQCGIVNAIVNLARMYCGLPHDILSEVEPPEKSQVVRAKVGFKYMEEAAQAGDRPSMVFVARAYDTGMNLDDPANKSAKLALDWYERICEQDEENGGDSSDWGMDDPPYMLMARQAEILLEQREDGDEVKRDPSKAGELYSAAADSAMACMKGKLANKYYMLAEEAWGECEEE